MSDTSIVPGSAQSGTPARFGTHASSVAGVDPITGGPVSIDPGVPVTSGGSGSSGTGGPVIFFARATGGSAALDAAANVLGLASSAGESPGKASFVFTGPLTIDDWTDSVGSMGLSGGKVYYLSTTPGMLTDVAPSVPGQYVVPVGFAMSSTTMWVQIGVPVVVPG